MHELTSTKRKWPLFQSMAFVSLGYCPKIKEIQNKFKKRKKKEIYGNESFTNDCQLAATTDTKKSL